MKRKKWTWLFKVFWYAFYWSDSRWLVWDDLWPVASESGVTTFFVSLTSFWADVAKELWRLEIWILDSPTVDQGLEALPTNRMIICPPENLHKRQSDFYALIRKLSVWNRRRLIYTDDAHFMYLSDNYRLGMAQSKNHSPGKCFGATCHDEYNSLHINVRTFTGCSQSFPDPEIVIWGSVGRSNVYASVLHLPNSSHLQLYDVAVRRSFSTLQHAQGKRVEHL